MKPFKVITEPQAIKLVGDPTRRRIIYLLRARELTVSQIADELEISPQAIYRHVGKLVTAGMLEVSREERIENFIETYYRATAEVFEYSYGEAKSQPYAELRLTEALQSVSKLGVSVTMKKEDIQKLVETQRKLRSVGMKQEFMDNAARLEGSDSFGKQEILHLARLISMTDKQFEDWLQLNREFRGVLKAIRFSPIRIQATRAKAGKGPELG